MTPTMQTPAEEVLNRLKRNWPYEGRPTRIRWDDGPFGGWLLVRFSDRSILIDYASPILSSIEVIKAIFPGKFHNPLCQWGDFGDYHMSDDGHFSESCLIDRAEYEAVRLPVFGEYEYLRQRR